MVVAQLLHLEEALRADLAETDALQVTEVVEAFDTRGLAGLRSAGLRSAGLRVCGFAGPRVRGGFAGAGARVGPFAAGAR
ncbi:hypothetical protein ADK57_03730 [Streptomyces sp. MMG1533]|nr:hypothetical protein ADK57_03730 [Streptomyces sp. MMG1533]